MDYGLADRTAIVTGAGNGIGSRTAEFLAAEGAKVVIVDINGEAAERLADIIVSKGGCALGLEADVTVSTAVSQACETAASRIGTPEILVNNAGFTRDNRIGRMTEDDWDAVIDVVLKGAYLCTKAVLPGMITNKWGRIINVSSRAYLGNPGQANYSAAKAGLLGFTRAMALENGRHGITVNAVAPGIIDTQAVKNLPHFEKIKSAAEANLPLPRLGTVDDVAAGITFLASDSAAYVTGDVLHVTGGRY